MKRIHSITIVFIHISRHVISICHELGQLDLGRVHVSDCPLMAGCCRGGGESTGEIIYEVEA